MNATHSTERAGEKSAVLLDLFSCQGGAATGYHRAGFEVVGVDCEPQPRYPFEFHQTDAVTLLRDLIDGWSIGGFAEGLTLDEIDVIHASPPCQRYSDLAKRNGNAGDWPDLIPWLRILLHNTGKPYIIENVEGAPLHDPVMLCGTMFSGLRVLRHRLFESNVPLSAPEHGPHPLVFTHDKRKAHYGQLDQDTSFVQVTGGGNATIANKRAAMGIDWMDNHGLNEAIPPAYTEHVGRQLMEHIRPTVPAMAGASEAARIGRPTDG